MHYYIAGTEELLKVFSLIFRESMFLTLHMLCTFVLYNYFSTITLDKLSEDTNLDLGFTSVNIGIIARMLDA